MSKQSEPNQRKPSRTRRVMNHVSRKNADARSPTVDRAATIAHQTVDRMAIAAAPAAGWVDARATRLKERQTKLLATGLRLVQERPLAILGVVLAFGYALGRLRR